MPFPFFFIGSGDAYTRVDVRSAVMELVGNDAHMPGAEIDVLTQLRFDHIYETWHWTRRMRDIVIALAAQTVSSESNLVTVTRGSQVVTAAGAAFTSEMSGFQIDIGDLRQYLYLNYVSPTEISLTDPDGNIAEWPLASASGQSWRVFKTVYNLGSNVEALLSLAGDTPIEELDGGRDALDQKDPDRTVADSMPRCWLYGNPSATGAKTIEIWPVPTQDRMIRGKVLRKAPALSDSTPLGINRALLVYAVTSDALNALHAKTGDIAYKDLALFYERKYKEVDAEIKPIEIERSSPPVTLQRARGISRDWDYRIKHLDDEP